MTRAFAGQQRSALHAVDVIAPLCRVNGTYTTGAVFVSCGATPKSSTHLSTLTAGGRGRTMPPRGQA